MVKQAVNSRARPGEGVRAAGSGEADTALAGGCYIAKIAVLYNKAVDSQEHFMTQHYDVIIIGTGAGGGMLAYR